MTTDSQNDNYPAGTDGKSNTDNNWQPDKPGSNSLLKSVCSNWATLIVSLIIGFFLTPYIIDKTGKNDYGLFKLVASLIGYYGLLEMGVRSAVDRYVARYLGQRDYDGLNRVVSTALAFYGGISILVFIVLIFLPDTVSAFLGITGENAVTFKHLLWVTGLTFIVTVIGAVFTSILLGHEKFIDVNIIQITRNLIRAILIIIALGNGYGIVSISLVNLFELSVAAALWATMSYRYTPELKLGKKSVHWATLRSLFTFGLASILLSVSNLLRYQLDNIVIAKWLSAERIAVYSIAVFLLSYLTRLMMAATDVYMPRFSRLSGLHDTRNEIQQLLKRGVTYSASFMCFLSAGLLFGGRAFIHAWVGEGFDDAYTIAFILALGGVFTHSQMPVIHVLRAENKHYLAGLLLIGEGVVNFILSIILIKKYGLPGVALGTLLPMAITMLLLYPVIASRVSGVGLSDYYRSLLLPIILWLPFCAVCWFWGMPSDFQKSIAGLSLPLTRGICLALIIGASMIYAGIYAVLCYLLIFPKAEKELITGKFRNLKKKYLCRRKDEQN